MKFIGIQKEILSLVGRKVGSGQGGQLKGRHQKRAQEAAVGFADEALAQVGDEDTPAIHHEAEIDLGANLAKNVAQAWSEKYLPHFILYRPDDLLTEATVVFGEFIQPERAHHRVF